MSHIYTFLFLNVTCNSTCDPTKGGGYQLSNQVDVWPPASRGSRLAHSDGKHQQQTRSARSCAGNQKLEFAQSVPVYCLH